MQTEQSLSLANPNPIHTSGLQKLGLAAISISVLLLLVTWASGHALGNPSPKESYVTVMLTIVFSLAILGTFLYVREEYLNKPEGIKNNGAFFKSLTYRGLGGWMLGVLLTGFYIILYWFPDNLKGLVQLFDPLSMFFTNHAADSWFVYGTLIALQVSYADGL